MLDKEAVKEAVKEALNEEIKPFFIERELHYQHHQFISEIITWSNKFKSSIMSTLAKGITILIFSLITLGIIFWGKQHFK